MHEYGYKCFYHLHKAHILKYRAHLFSSFYYKPYYNFRAVLQSAFHCERGSHSYHCVVVAGKLIRGLTLYHGVGQHQRKISPAAVFHSFSLTAGLAVLKKKSFILMWF